MAKEEGAMRRKGAMRRVNEEGGKKKKRSYSMIIMETTDTP